MSQIDTQRKNLLKSMAEHPDHPAYVNVTAIGIGVRDQEGNARPAAATARSNCEGSNA